MAEEEKKTPAQIERDNIKVTNNAPAEEKVEEVKDDETVDAKSDSEIEAVEEKEDEIEVSEEKEEELEEAKVQAKTQGDKDRIQRRIDREVAKRKAAEEEVVSLRAQLAAKPDDEKGLTQEEVNKQAKTLAQQMKLEEDFVRDCNKLAKDATKIDPKFKMKIDALAEDIGGVPSQVVGILADLDNGGAVLNYLSDNPDEAENIWTLSPAKQALELSKIELKLSKKPEKKLSKVPPPNDPVGGKGNNPEVLTGKESMADYVRIRAKQVEDRRKARMGMH